MYLTNEDEHEYRHGGHGPKYLEQGPVVEFGIVRLMPGEVVAAHKHLQLHECFYILDGELSFSVDGKEITRTTGDYLRLEPGEGHEITNTGDMPSKMVIVKAPYVPGDKVDL